MPEYQYHILHFVDNFDLEDMLLHYNNSADIHLEGDIDYNHMLLQQVLTQLDYLNQKMEQEIYPYELDHLL